MFAFLPRYSGCLHARRPRNTPAQHARRFPPTAHPHRQRGVNIIITIMYTLNLSLVNARAPPKRRPKNAENRIYIYIYTGYLRYDDSETRINRRRENFIIGTRALHLHPKTLVYRMRGRGVVRS